MKENGRNWPKISDHSYKILVIRGSGKTNTLFNLMCCQPDIKKGPYENLMCCQPDIKKGPYEFIS